MKNTHTHPEAKKKIFIFKICKEQKLKKKITKKKKKKTCGITSSGIKQRLGEKKKMNMYAVNRY